MKKIRREWSEREDAILRECYPNEGAMGCVARLENRSANSVYRRAHRLELHVTAEAWMANAQAVRCYKEGKPPPQGNVETALRQEVRILMSDGEERTAYEVAEMLGEERSRVIKTMANLAADREIDCREHETLRNGRGHPLRVYVQRDLNWEPAKANLEQLVRSAMLSRSPLETAWGGADV